MKWILISLVAIFILGNSFLYQYRTSEGCLILWQTDKKLTRDDFRAKPARRNAVASTVYSINKTVTADENGKLVAHIKTFFICDESWMIKKWSDDAVLAHEQKHFDMAELFARKLRKQITGLAIRDLDDAKSKVDSLYSIIDKEMDTWQDQYDEETDHSMDKEGQKKWNEKIMSGIEALKAYKETDILLKLSSRTN